MQDVQAWMQATYDPFVLALALGGSLLSLAFWSVLEWLLPAERGQPLSGRLYSGVASALNALAGRAGSFVAASVAAFVMDRTVGSALVVVDLDGFLKAQPAFWYVLLILPVALLPLIIGDFFYYWFHRAQHAWPWLWEQHKLHHTEEHLNCVSGYRHHWLEHFLRAPFIAVPIALFIDLTPAQVGLVLLIYGQLTWYIHANLRLHLGPLAAVIGGPQYHRIHHSIEARHRNRNFAAFIPAWDIIFRTAWLPDRAEWPRTGVEGEVANPPATGLLLGPFIAWWGMVRGRLGGAQVAAPVPPAALSLGLLTALAAASPALAQPAAPMIRAPQGELVATLPDGSTRRGTALAGSTLDLGPAHGLLRIAEARPDPRDSTGETWLYDLRRRDATGAWAIPACEAAHDGTRAVIFLETVQGAIEPHCANVNVAKCVRMGYAPWRRAPDGRSLADFHRACLRMLPAEYAGDGRYHTRNGTPIETFDLAGVNSAENETGMPFEAGWAAQGAVCVAHARVPAITDMPALALAAPRLAAEGRLGAEACTEETARALGALVFNRSATE